MRINRLLILLLSSKRPLITSAQLVARQEQGAWPDLDPVGAVLSGIELFRGIGDAIGAGAENLFLGPQGSESSKTEPQPAAEYQSDPDTTSDGNISPNSPTVPVYKIKIDNSKDPLLSPLPEPEPNPPAVFTSVNDLGCDKTMDQLIFTTSCAIMTLDQVVSDEVKALNQAIYDALFDMNAQNVLARQGGPGLRTSREIENKPGVGFVSPNRALSEQIMPATFRPENLEPAAIPPPNVPRGRLQKRARLVQDPRAGEDLRFISTGPDERLLSRNYLYYEEAGRGATIFAVGGAVNTLHDDFATADGERSILTDRINGMDASDLPDNVATCRVSKMVGRTHGVAKKAKVMIVNIVNTEGSFLDGLAQVSEYLTRKHLFGESYQGHYVMSLMELLDLRDDRLTEAFNRVLDFLVKTVQLVVVVQSGLDESNSNSDIVQWPATTAGRQDIIVVGAVDIDGRTMSISRGGPFLTVTGPGVGKCADQPVQFRGADRYYGPDLAAAASTGLIAYWFSLPDVGPTLRRDVTDIASVVKSFIELVSYVRRPNGDTRAIWNMLPQRQMAMGTEPDIIGLQPRGRISKLPRAARPHERNL